MTKVQKKCIHSGVAKPKFGTVWSPHSRRAPLPFPPVSPVSLLPNPRSPPCPFSTPLADEEELALGEDEEVAAFGEEQQKEEGNARRRTQGLRRGERRVPLVLPEEPEARVAGARQVRAAARLTSPLAVPLVLSSPFLSSVRVRCRRCPPRRARPLLLPGGSRAALGRAPRPPPAGGSRPAESPPFTTGRRGTACLNPAVRFSGVAVILACTQQEQRGRRGASAGRSALPASCT